MAVQHCELLLKFGCEQNTNPDFEIQVRSSHKEKTHGIKFRRLCDSRTHRPTDDMAVCSEHV
jgi:hypothetical protein